MHPTPHVLLLEDDPAIARTVCYALERDGIHCTHSLLILRALPRPSRFPLPAARAKQSRAQTSPPGDRSAKFPTFFPRLPGLLRQ